MNDSAGKSLLFGEMRIPTTEAVRKDMTQQDMNDSADAMYKIRSEMMEMMRDMSIGECDGMLDVMRKYKEKLPG